MTSFIFRCLLILFLLNFSTRTSCFTLPPGGVKIPLIHRSSLPKHSNETFESIVQRNLELLTIKFAALDQEAKYIIQTPLMHFIETGSVYLVNVTIRNPPVPQYLLIHGKLSHVGSPKFESSETIFLQPRRIRYIRVHLLW